MWRYTVRVVYQFSWSTSLYCVNFHGFTKHINATGTLPAGWLTSCGYGFTRLIN
jgi:hypothetical protein